jgi:glycosyltransferase involved in cell wall biosynthesis
MIAPFPYKEAKIKGGVEAVTVNLLEGFKNISNIEMLVISIQKTVLVEEIIEYSESIKIHYIPYGRIKSTKLEMLFHARIRVKQIANVFKPDIIHIQGNGTILLLTIGLKKENLVITQHGILKEELKYIISLSNRISQLISIKIEKLFESNIKNRIYISDYNKQLSEIKLNKSKNNTIIFNPVSNSFFYNNVSNIKNSNRLLYVGSIIKRKGLIDLLIAIKILKDKNINFHLDVVGDFQDESYKSEIINYTNKYELSKQITYHGWLYSNEIQRLLHKDSIFVLPSYQETLPVVIAEAMASGKVVVATNIAGIPEMVEEGKTGFLFERGNVNELIEILTKLSTIDKKLHSELSYKRALKMFSADIVAKQTFQFYKDVISN